MRYFFPSTKFRVTKASTVAQVILAITCHGFHALMAPGIAYLRMAGHKIARWYTLGGGIPDGIQFECIKSMTFRRVVGYIRYRFCVTISIEYPFFSALSSTTSLSAQFELFVFVKYDQRGSTQLAT